MPAEFPAQGGNAPAIRMANSSSTTRVVVLFWHLGSYVSRGTSSPHFIQLLGRNKSPFASVPIARYGYAPVERHVT